MVLKIHFPIKKLLTATKLESMFPQLIVILSALKLDTNPKAKVEIPMPLTRSKSRPQTSIHQLIRQ